MLALPLALASSTAAPTRTSWMKLHHHHLKHWNLHCTDVMHAATPAATPLPATLGRGRGIHAGMSATTRVTHCPPCTGAQIAQHILQSRFFKEAHSVGLYITCERLREVDTTALLDGALQHGTPHEPLACQEAA